MSKAKGFIHGDESWPLRSVARVVLALGKGDRPACLGRPRMAVSCMFRPEDRQRAHRITWGPGEGGLATHETLWEWGFICTVLCTVYMTVLYCTVCTVSGVLSKRTIPRASRARSWPVLCLCIEETTAAGRVKAVGRLERSRECHLALRPATTSLASGATPWASELSRCENRDQDDQI